MCYLRKKLLYTKYLLHPKDCDGFSVMELISNIIQNYIINKS